MSDAEREGADQRAPQVADAAEDHDHEAVDDVALAEIGRDVVDLAERHAGHAGNAGAEREGERIDPGRADAHGRRHAAVLGDGAHLQAQARVRFRTNSRAQKTASAKTMIQRRFQVIVRPPSSNGAGHPGRVADLAVGRAEDGAHRLLEDQRYAPGGQQRFQRPAVEEADDAALDGDADGAGDEEGERQGDRQRPVERGPGSASRMTSWTTKVV